MTTGNANKTAAAAKGVKGLRFEDDRLIVAFRDGREIHVPLRLYPTLQKATPAERDAWELIGPGKAFHWRALDLDLSVDGLIQGLRESIPAPPQRAARRSA